MRSNILKTAILAFAVGTVLRPATFGANATSTIVSLSDNNLPQVQVAPMPTTYPGLESITVRADVTDQDGVVKKVILFVDNETVAVDEIAPYEFVFTPPVPGIYFLQVRAEDDRGGIGAAPQQMLIFEGAADDFGPGMLVLTSTNLTPTASTLNATRQKGEPLHAGVEGGKSIWWAWRVPLTLANGGILSIDTVGSDFDTLLAVYSGGPQGTSDITKLKLLAANDDDITFPPASRVKLFVSSNDLLYIAVDGREGVSGTVKLRLSFTPAVAPPMNDNYVRAFSAGFSSYQGSNVGASHEPDEPAHAGNPGGASVWWRLQVSNTRPRIQITTANSTFDTLLAVYTTNLPSHLPPVGFTNFMLIAANDDASYNTRSSAITFHPPKAGTYWIAVDGYNNAQGRVTLNITASEAHLNVNDHITEAISLTGAAIVRTGDNFLATIQPGEPLHAGTTNSGSLWFKWTAPTNGLVTISTRGSDFDTVLAVYKWTNLSSFLPVASNDDDPANPPASALRFYASQGTQYFFAIAGYGTARGEFALALNQSPGLSPRLHTERSQGRIVLNAVDTQGTALLEASTNLVDWQIVDTLIGSETLEIAPNSETPWHFYRLRLVE